MVAVRRNVEDWARDGARQNAAMGVRVRRQESFGKPHVVVDEDDDLTLCDLDAAITSGAAIRFGNVDPAYGQPAGPLVRGDNLGRSVARAVVGDDDFKRGRIPLRRKRLQRARKKLCSVARRNDHREHHTAASRSERAMRSAAPA